MTLLVDFNLEDDQGRVPAVLRPEQLVGLHVGDTVLAEDDEGNRCKAFIAEVSRERSVAFLALQTATWEAPSLA